jgi:hypothetical protein
MVFSNVIKDKKLRIVGGLSLLLLAVGTIIFYARPAPATAPLIIHFEAYGGIDFTGEKTEILGILLSALIIIMINLFLSDFLYTRERFLSYIFTFVSLLFSILILITIGVIISVN